MSNDEIIDELFKQRDGRVTTGDDNITMSPEEIIDEIMRGLGFAPINVPKIDASVESSAVEPDATPRRASEDVESDDAP